MFGKQLTTLVILKVCPNLVVHFIVKRFIPSRNLSLALPFNSAFLSKIYFVFSSFLADDKLAVFVKERIV